MHPRSFGQKSPVRTQRPHPHSDYPTYGQMTAVKKGYPLISVTWLYRALKCTTDWSDVFLKLSANQLSV